MIWPPRAATSCMLETVFSKRSSCGRHDDDRHVLVDEGDGPVLQLAGGIALGVDVGDLLELQRAFERERIACPAARGRARRAPSTGSCAIASYCCSLRRIVEMWRGTSISALTSAAPAPRRSRRARARARSARQASTRKLAREGLGRGDADLGAGQRRQHDVGLARDRGGAHVDDGGDALALGLGSSAASRACRRSHPTGKRTATGRPSPAAARGSASRRRHRSRPAAARSARSSICRRGRRSRRCRRPRCVTRASWARSSPSRGNVHAYRQPCRDSSTACG